MCHYQKLSFYFIFIEQIGKYKILSAFGAGEMGGVFLAEDTHLNRKVALKILPAPLAGMFTFIAKHTLRTLHLWSSDCLFFVVR